MAKCKYKFTDEVPVHQISGYNENAKGLLVFESKLIKGLTPFGSQAGVLTEEDLTDSIVDFLMSKDDELGRKLYEKYFVKSKN